MIRLGVNIDHIATLRQQRGTPYPNLVAAGLAAQQAGADQITIHLREDRRHIQDEDVFNLKSALDIPLNLEMALSEDILRIAIKSRPAWVCFVPEKRKELTTEGGLNLERKQKKLSKAITKLKKLGIKVSLFIEPSRSAVRLSKALGADAVELHTGRYALAMQSNPVDVKLAAKELKKVARTCSLAKELKMGAHVGHGLDYENTAQIASLQDENGTLVEEANIGHSVVCRATEVGLSSAVSEMRRLLNEKQEDFTKKTMISERQISH